MQDNPSTNITDNTEDNDDLSPRPAVERDEWELAFEPFEENAYAAIRMGLNIALLKKHLDTQLFKPRPVMEALEDAMEVLFPYTPFHNASFDLFIKFMEGKLSFEEEQMLRRSASRFDPTFGDNLTSSPLLANCDVSNQTAFCARWRSRLS